MLLIFVQQASLRDVPGLITNSYMLASAFAIIMIGIAFLIGKLISVDLSPNRKDTKKRRIVYWTLLVLTPILFYLYNFMIVIPNIKKGPAFSKFFIHGALSALAALIIYFIVGFVLSKAFKNTTLGHWFPTKKK